uniref:RNA-directed DNA polymerase, eukaryota, nucleotide-binding alpha-beta plait domain protein n=1 Tax=Tanacetum cinerariifolium TaxID=118510 RepID=A0A699HCF4_TANCI|nr:RNA-directed DNA polymerase, eukaryota, nucleotide-binding alpha-beta plait domain protein [Tanacetum cinerariifolium]
MGYSSNSKEDQARQISNSVFVTIFLIMICCAICGRCVAIMVRLLMSTSLSRNLKLDWSFRLHANVVRFHRDPKPSVWKPKDSYEGTKPGVNVGNSVGSFASVLKKGNPVYSPFEDSQPSLVLDDTCNSDRDLSMSLMGKVKNISSLSNLYLTIKEEGLPLKVWTQNTFNKIASKWGKLVEVEDYGVSSFSHKRLCLRTKFVDLIGERFKVIVQGRLYLIRVKELKPWVPDFHDKKYGSSSSDGEQFEEDDGQVSGTKKQDKVNNDDNEVDRVYETSFGCDQDSMHENLNKLPVDEVHSEDPFKIYDILEKKKENTGHSSEEEPKFLSGFTPIDKDGEEEVTYHIDHPEIAENNMEPGISNDSSQRCKNLFSKVQNGGSFLDVMDELVKVGQTIGYNMEGCMNNIGSIIGSQGDVKHLSDHLLILMRELNVDFGSISFRVFHSWFNMEGFDKMVEHSWKNSNFVETNGMVLLKKKLQML